MLLTMKGFTENDLQAEEQQSTQNPLRPGPTVIHRSIMPYRAGQCLQSTLVKDVANCFTHL